MIPSAAGERQIFPKQTKSIFVSMAAKIVQDARSAKFIGSCRAAARPKGGACADNPRYNKSDTSYILNSILCDYSEPNSSYGGSGSGQIVMRLGKMAPWIVGRYEDGTWGTFSDGSPLAWLDVDQTVRRENQNFSGMLGG